MFSVLWLSQLKKKHLEIISGIREALLFRKQEQHAMKIGWGSETNVLGN